mmetsp:Transcript_37259/g.81681  ORF Transcript_37259/g.81681 Transcript_37259/m.81681 type:complete len:210 (+) Transcript_37259:189-818(+)
MEKSNLVHVDEDEGLAFKDIVDHDAEDSHHSGTAVVELNIKLAGLLLGVLDLGSEVTNTVVTVVLGGGHPGKLDKGEEGKDLSKTGGGDGADAINTVGDVGELEVGGGGKVSVELDVVLVDDGSNDGGHGNTSVLALDGTTTLEGLGLGLEPAKGIVNAKGLGNTKLKLRDGKVGGDTAGLGGGEGGGGADKGSEGSKLVHVESLMKVN